VSYFGEGCFRLQSGEISLLVNPINNRLKADVVLKTLSPASTTEAAGAEISFPGEYEVKGIEVRGLPLEHESSPKFLKTIFVVKWEDLRIVFLGHISKQLPPELLKEVGEPDILFIPGGEEHFLSPEDAAKLIKQAEPKVVIPGFYKTPTAFLKAVGQKVEAAEKFVFKNKDLEGKKGAIVILEPKNG